MSLKERVSETIDIRGQICPYTLMETRDKLQELEPGRVLEVLCDYEPAATTTIPSFCRKRGYPLECVADGGGSWRLYIEKAD